MSAPPEPGAAPTRAVRRRRWVVPSVLAAALAVAIVLIVTGQSDDDPATPIPDPPGAGATGQPLRWLGAFPDDGALRAVLRGLDPRTLTPLGASTATDVAPTAPPSSAGPAPAGAATSQDAQRCDRGIIKTSTDPLGTATAAVSASLEGSPVLVTTYEVQAVPDHPAGLRTFVVDPRSCRVLTAIDRPG